MDYKFGQKNHWRRWLHNRIAERLKVPARDAVVLYLAGEKDLDRAEFLRRGYRPDNLIAVDVDGEVVAALRKRGVIAIQGKIETIARLWSRRLDVVIADFMGPLTTERFHAVSDAVLGNVGPTWAVNLLRGREERGNPLIVPFENNDTKHRGARLVAGIPAAMICGDEAVSGVGPTDAGRKLNRMLIDAVKASCFSYKSTSGQYFDSVVFDSAPFYYLNVAIPTARTALPEDYSARRRIAAAIAHSTRRVGRSMPANEAFAPVLH
ncbi:MAG: hypothetical protein AB7N70_13980 [Dehalococcoidia bacterium]